MDSQTIRSETLPLMVVVDAGNVIQRALERRLQGLEISVAQGRILELLYLSSEPLTPSLLAALLLQEAHSVSGLLNRLEDRDLITRTRTRQDRRMVLVGLTPAGRTLAEASMAIAHELAREVKGLFAGKKGTEALNKLAEVRDQGLRLVDVDQETRTQALTRVWG